MRSSVYLRLLEGFSSSMVLDVLALFLLLKYACRLFVTVCKYMWNFVTGKRVQIQKYL